MMSDIVERIRSAQFGSETTLADKAADEIEQLRVKVAEYEKEEAEYDFPPDALVAQLRAEVEQLKASNQRCADWALSLGEDDPR